MWELVLEKQKNIKVIIINVIVFLLIFSIYTYMDNYGYQNYKMLGQAFGYSTVFATIFLNFIISIISSISISLAYVNYKLMGNGKKGSILSSIGNIIGIYFSGCASCGLSLLSSIGIGFISPVITPGAIKYKFIALLVIIAGLLWIIHSIKHSKCKI